MAQIELVGSEYNPALESDTPDAATEAPKPTGVRSRLAAAAKRLRGDKTEAPKAKQDSTSRVPTRRRATKKTDA